MTREKELAKAYSDGYKDGWSQSAEGYNAEYPCGFELPDEFEDDLRRWTTKNETPQNRATNAKVPHSET